MIDGAGTEFPEEFLRTQTTEVLDDEGPEMKDVVSGHTIPFFHDHHFRSQ